MIVTNNKIKVFISSACGREAWKQKYNIARAGLKAIIEATGIGEVYLFEDEGASIRTAGKHYTSALEKCDVCIFLIDNLDGVPDGVQIEVECVNKHHIKSLYYFCDKDSKETTALQRSLIGAEFAKSKEVHSFEEVIKNGAEDLINDLMNIYKDYCRGDLNYRPTYEEKIDVQLGSNYSDANKFLISKEKIANIDKCQSYFFSLINNRGEEIKNTSELDEWCYRFLLVLFQNKNINDFNMQIFLKVLEENHDPKYYSLVELRWLAIQAYFQGKLEEVVEYLERALQYARENAVPEWVVKDILIDLRNQSALLGESKNLVEWDTPAQRELNEGEHSIYYPLLDRIENTLNEMYCTNILQEQIKSPYTISLGRNYRSCIESLASIYVVAMYNGSLTHIILMYKRIKLFAFHFCQLYSQWEFRMLLMKCALMDYRENELKGIVNNWENILGKMDGEDALEIYEFTNNQPIKHRRLISNLNTLKCVGYHLDDEVFNDVFAKVLNDIYEWVEDKERCIVIGDSLMKALEGIALRMNQNDLAKICIAFIEKNFNRWLDRICVLIGRYINAQELNKELKKHLTEQLKYLIINQQTLRLNKMEYLLMNFSEKNKEIMEVLLDHIKQYMSYFYERQYILLEILENKELDANKQIEDRIERISQRNQKQGVNGTYSGWLDNPYGEIEALVSNNGISIVLRNKVFEISADTLFSNTQTIEAKCQAIGLLVFLCKKYPSVMEDMNGMVEQLKAKRSIVENGKNILSNLSLSALRFIALFLYECFGETITFDIIEMFPCFDDDLRTQILVAEYLLDFLQLDFNWNSEVLDSVILQQSLVWCRSSAVEVREKALMILFELLKNENNKRTIENQLMKSMEHDNAYIKNIILRQIKSKNVSQNVREYLLQKAKNDANYVVRKVYKELFQKVGI